MKKAAVVTAVVSMLAFVIVWGVLGLNIMNHDYEAVSPPAYTGLASLALFLISVVVLRWGSWKCPHCGKLRITNGRFCSYCGKEI